MKLLQCILNDPSGFDIVYGDDDLSGDVDSITNQDNPEVFSCGSNSGNGSVGQSVSQNDC